MRKLRFVVATALLVSGCALQDTRYDYSRLSAGLGDYDESILDWNFPTSTNQGPLLPPERFRPWRPAIGVPWATGDWMPWQQGMQPPPKQKFEFAPAHDERSPCANDCGAPLATADVEGADADARIDERSDVSMRR